MKKIRLIVTALFCAFAFATAASAQMDERAPGLYAVVGEESIPLTFSIGTTAVTTTNIIGIEMGKRKFSYKEPASGVTAADTFVLVIDPEKKGISKTLKSYNPFVKSMTPNNIMILPLYVDKNKRIYEEGKTIAGINLSVKDRMDFEWEQITDNSFVIRVQNLIPGEYGFIFRAAKLAEFDYSAIFGFTFPEQ